MAERLGLPTSDHGVTGSNPAGGKILPELKQRFIAQSLSCSLFHRLEMTEILLKGCKTLTHPILLMFSLQVSSYQYVYLLAILSGRVHLIFTSHCLAKNTAIIIYLFTTSLRQFIKLTFK